MGIFTIQVNQTINILEDDIGIYIYESLSGNGFLKTQKRVTMKERIEKNKKAPSLNTPMWKMKREVTDWKKISLTCITIKRFVPRIYRIPTNQFLNC